MANNYCESSSFVTIPADKMEAAKLIVERVATEIQAPDAEGYDGYLGYASECQEDGVWLYSDESMDPEHAEKLVRALVDELELPDTIVCSWSYTCSKLRIDEFGGGAFAIKLGKPTVWVDAVSEATRQLEKVGSDTHE